MRCRTAIFRSGNSGAKETAGKSRAGSKNVRLDGQTALLIGAGRGIGETMAHAFARCGANLALVARTSAEIEKVALHASTLGVSAIAYPADVSNGLEVRALMAAVIQKFGRIDVLVNGAGIYGPIGPFVDNDLGQWSAAIETNLMG